MKAVSVDQPHATLLTLGAGRRRLKCYETRPWATKHRGPIAIHATKRKVDNFWLTGKSDIARYIRSTLHFAGMDIRELVHGAVIAVAVLTRVHRTDGINMSPLSIEWALGDFSTGRFAWRLDKMHTLTEPAPCRGKQGLWNLPPDVERAVLKQIEGQGESMWR